MIYIGDEVEISFKKGGECVVKYQNILVKGIKSIDLLLTVEYDRRICKAIRPIDKNELTTQSEFCAEMVKAGFDIIFEKSNTYSIESNIKFLN